MKVIRFLLTPLILLSTSLLFFYVKKNYILMVNDDRKNGIFTLYKRKDVEYLL